MPILWNSPRLWISRYLKNLLTCCNPPNVVKEEGLDAVSDRTLIIGAFDFSVVPFSHRAPPMISYLVGTPAYF